MIYRAILAIRHLMYDKGWKKSFKAEVPTICIGNITAGGTGKTPHTELVLRLLLGSDRWAYSEIAMLSRGYRRKTGGFQKVGRDGTARAFGDEPVQIAKKFLPVTVAVDKDRVEGCHFLVHPEDLATSKKGRKCLDKEFPAAEVIVLDDAFQHRALRSDVNIVLVDYSRPVQKDRLIPWGHLRDLPSRLGKADIIVVSKCPSYVDEWERGKWAAQLGIGQYNTASCKGVNLHTQKAQTLVFTTLGYHPLTPVFPEADNRYMYAKRLMLVTGIARSRPLLGYLSDNYSVIRDFHFPDHHRFTRGDIRRVSSALKAFPTACIATTEKDAQRILDLKKVPDNIRQRLFQVPVEVQFLTDREKEVFEQTLLSLI